jgi:hypothetical protein
MPWAQKPQTIPNTFHLDGVRAGIQAHEHQDRSEAYGSLHGVSQRLNIARACSFPSVVAPASIHIRFLKNLNRKDN